MLDWLFPQTVETFQSKFNGEVRVVKSFGKLSVVVGGYQQSGPMIERVWRKALENQKSKIKGQKFNSKIKSILILGLGAGTLVPIFQEQYPNIHEIVGVEIDSVMVEIGKKYFALDKQKRLKIEIGDAFDSLIRIIERKEKFGLVVVDIYRGNVMGKGMDLEFVGMCRNLLEKGGLLVVNLLVFGPKAQREKEFLKQVQSKFEVKVVKVDYNHFVFIQR